MYYLIQTLLVIPRGDMIIISFYMWEHWVLAMSGACHFGQAFPWWSKMVISSARHSILKILSPVNRDLLFFNWSVVDLQCFRCPEYWFSFIHIWAHSSILSWRIPGTEEPGGLQSMGSRRVGHEWATNIYKLSSIFLSIIGYCKTLNIVPCAI